MEGYFEPAMGTSFSDAVVECKNHLHTIDAQEIIMVFNDTRVRVNWQSYVGDIALIYDLERKISRLQEHFKNTVTDRFDNEITDGCMLSVQKLTEPVKVTKIGDDLFFAPYGHITKVREYFKNDLEIVK